MADIEKMRQMLLNPKWYIENQLYIRTKESKLEHLKMNAAQTRLYQEIEREREAGRPVRIIILKARQMGFSTVTEAMIFHRAATRENVNALIVAHQDDSTALLFQMSRRFLENLPPPLKPMTKASNAQEIVFENPDKRPAKRATCPGLKSRIRCKTAGGRGIGRGDTIQLLHASEFAFWPGDKAATWAGIMQAVPATPETMVIIESTANGYDKFHEMWQAAEAGESDFVPLFFPWFESPEYRRKPDPGTIWTQGERELSERYGLDEEQLAWRRWCIRNNCAGDEEMFRQEYPSYPEEAFLLSGSPVFDEELLAARLQSEREPEETGEFEYKTDPENPARIWDIKWAKRDNGCVRIYRKPESGKPYVIGGDTAGTGSDWFTGQVLDNITGRQAAVLRHQYDEDQYARQMYCLGMHYNKALIGVEVNYSTYPVKLLSIMRYPRLYVRELPDSFEGKLKKAYGWNTNSRTRPAMIAELVQRFREDPELVADRATLAEMKVFQYNDDHRPEALPGEHDDLVMALAIADAIRGQQDMTMPKRTQNTDGWTKDMLEDYWRADEQGKAYLMAKWGKG